MTAKPARFGPFLHYDGPLKARENSPAGIGDAAGPHGPDGRGSHRIDLDTQMTLAVAAVKGATPVRTFAGTHWADLRDHQWTVKSEKVAHELGIHGIVAGRPCKTTRVNVHRLPWDLVSTAVAIHGGSYPIRSLGSQIRLAAREEVGIEHEPKDVPTVEEFRRIFAVARSAYGEDWRDHYLVKRLWTNPGAKTCLKNARAADAHVRTVAINIGTLPVKDLPPYVSHYRR